MNDLDEESHTVGSFGVTELLVRAGMKEVDRSDVAALLLVCEWSNFDVHRLQRGQLVEDHTRPHVSLDNLKAWFSSLGSYRHIQKKIQVCLETPAAIRIILLSFAGCVIDIHASDAALLRHHLAAAAATILWER